MHGDEALSYKISKTPTTAIVREIDYGIRFIGLTAGHEFSSFLESLVTVSDASGLSKQLQEMIASINKPVHIKVMTTLTCPYCPQMVRIANLFAYYNSLIDSTMYNIAEFPETAAKYKVEGVPRTVVNETNIIEGAIALPEFYLAVLSVVESEKYRVLEDEIRLSMGLRKVKPVHPNHVYDVIIVGGGPAGLSAAVYGYRKGLDIAVISDKIGGQLAYTARIDNYLGFSGISGLEMIEMFRKHLDQYPVAQTTEIKVDKISKKNGVFNVKTVDEVRYLGRAVILCTGMEYKRLGVLGEERLIGKGIAFCATCDAPLYLDKRVVVIGGGNSAFTALRDLLGFAKEIHLIHRGDMFSADDVLVNEILSNDAVIVHLSSYVIEFHGGSRLTGLTYTTASGEDLDLEIDGAFIEIGLEPNSKAVSDLVTLNEIGEVPVDLDGSTSMPGLFAGGDVTTVREKQISIAVGQGTSAALAAYNYLMKQKSTMRTRRS
jgi:alkyl hydroperoxide reductase subunit F